MFGFGSKIKDLEERLADINRRYVSLYEDKVRSDTALIETRVELDRLRPKVKAFEARKAYPATHFAIDFHKLGAYSVERVCGEDGFETTVIGYLINGITAEWAMDCNAEAHLEIVARFNEYRKLGAASEASASVLDILRDFVGKVRTDGNPATRT